MPTDGILADEMGVGKTIEIFDLILLNPRPLDEGPPEVSTPLDEGSPEKIKKTTEKVDKKQVECLCAQNKTNDTVSCTKCSKLQHRKCVLREILKLHRATRTFLQLVEEKRNQFPPKPRL